MNKFGRWSILSIALIVGMMPFFLLGWIGFEYLKYGSVTHEACQGYDWWEDEAECAAEFALEKNDPRYCRINLFGEIGDLCASIFANKTFDPTTCQAIDHIPSKNKCVQRLEIDPSKEN